MRKKCRRGERLIESVYFTSFIRGIAMDQEGSIYVVRSAPDSQVFKLDKNLNPLRVTCSRSSEHFKTAYQLLVTANYVLVCSAKKISILNLNLDHIFNLNLDFVPYGITILHGKHFITGDKIIAVIDMDLENSNNFKIMKWTRMEVNDGNEDFQENSYFRGICASNEYLLVTEVNDTDSNYRRLLCLQLIDNRLRCVAVKRGFSEHCGDLCDKERCSPVVIAHCNGENYYSQGYFDGVFHIVRVTITNNTLETKKLFDCNT